uniref:Uncharacterized protein n=1 Tax=Ciona savignyi TaxID=51511 RepID=H2Z033_CIOSA
MLILELASREIFPYQLEDTAAQALQLQLLLPVNSMFIFSSLQMAVSQDQVLGCSTLYQVFKVTIPVTCY